MSLISVVVPLKDEEGNVAQLLARVTTVLERSVRARGDDYEIVAVDDGSTDATLRALRDARAAQPRLTIVSLSRNFGHQIAATAGLDTSRGDAVILMDGDLQDPPELIEAFLAKWREGYDVVYATRRSRKGESGFKILTAGAFYRIIRRLTNVSIPVDTGDFRLMDRRVIAALAQTRERHRFLRGLVSWVGYRQTGIDYERDARLSGRTKYPLSKMLRFAFDGIASFSEIPLRFATWMGFIVSGFAFIYAVVVVVLKFLGLNEPGFTSTMVAILFLGGVQLIGIGILGEYVGRIYDQVKGRPLYLISTLERAAVRPPAESVPGEPVSQ